MTEPDFAVGQTVLEWRGPPRVRVWYPAAATHAPRLKTAWALLRRRLWGGGADSAPRELAPAAGAVRFPVVLYFSGWPGTQVDNCALLAALAARGFVVAALTYDDRTPQDYSSDAAARRTVQLAEQRVAERARDAVSVLDELYRQQAPESGSPFAGRLDPHRAGIMGFSFGGAIAAETSWLDARIRAVINIDGRHWGTALERGVAQPYLFIGEELAMPGAADFAADDADRRNNAALDLYDYTQLAANLRRNGGTQVVIGNTLHMNFCDAALRGRWTRRRDLGSIAPARGLEILNAHVLAFFERHLKFREADGSAPAAPKFAGTRVEHWSAPQAVGGVQT